MAIPTFRYLEDAVKLTKEIGDGVQELGASFKSKQKALAKKFNLEAFVDSKPKKPRMLSAITPICAKVAIPGGVKCLQAEYDSLSDLNEKYRTLEAVGTQVQMQFRGNRDIAKAEERIEAAKSKIEAGMRERFTFLNDLAKAHVPESFQVFANAVSNVLSKYVDFESKQQFLYASPSPKGSTVFTSYTILNGVQSSTGLTASLYIPIQWDSTTGDLKVHLDHDFELPSKLYASRSGVPVDNAQQAVREIRSLLSQEGF